jgi:hypothetical protein
MPPAGEIFNWDTSQTPSSVLAVSPTDKLSIVIGRRLTFIKSWWFWGW